MQHLPWYVGILLLCVVAACNSTGSGSGGGDPAGDPPGGLQAGEQDDAPPDPTGGGGGLPPMSKQDENGDDGAPGESDDDDRSASGYRKVTLAGTITTDNNAASVDLEPGEGLTAFEYIGDYQMELWFPMAGGEAVQQRNWVVLREGGYIPVYYGTATECAYTPHPDAYEEREMVLEATLTLNNLLVDGEPADELSLHLPDYPMDTVMVNVDCGGAPADVPDPGVYTQLQLYWHMQTLVYGIQLDEVATNTWTDVPMMPPYDMYYLTVSQNRSYEIVPTLD